MEIIINGQPRRIDEGTSLAALLEALELRPQHVAVEVNEELVPRAEHRVRLLAPGDRLEVVTLVGGG